MRKILWVVMCAAPVFGKVTINPAEAKVLVNQCFVYSAHFSAPVDKGGVREVSVFSDDPRLMIFAKADCSGGSTVTIPGHLQNFSFSVMPSPAAASVKLGIGLNANGESARAKVTVQ